MFGKRLAGIFFFFLLSSATAGEIPEELSRYCLKKGVDPKIVVAIARTEGLKGKGLFGVYPYVIRINAPYRIRGLKEVRPKVYDCRSREFCIAVSRWLVKHGILDFDMGTFQLNYYYQRERAKNIEEIAFDTRKAFKIVCDITAENLRKAGYTANAVALYHSSRPIRNYRWAVRFWKEYRKIAKSP